MSSFVSDPLAINQGEEEEDNNNSVDRVIPCPRGVTELIHRLTRDTDNESHRGRGEKWGRVSQSERVEMEMQTNL